MLIAQLTDTHVLDPSFDHPDHLVDNNHRLELAVERLGRERPKPDVVLATGDLTDTGSEIEMKLLVDLLAPLDQPVLALPGNHDLRATFRDAFDLPWAAEDNLSWAVDVGPVRLLGLDTLIPGSHGGRFDRPRRQWLEEALADAGPRPVIIAMHHPPFRCGIRWMDEYALEGLDAFVETVGGHPNVARILCGHLHRPMVTTVAGVTTSTGLSTIHHVELNLDPDAPIEVISDPGGYQLHHFHNEHWISHIRYIDTDAEPVRPDWDTTDG